MKPVAAGPGLSLEPPSALMIRWVGSGVIVDNQEGGLDIF